MARSPQQLNRKPLWQLLSAAAAGSTAFEVSGVLELAQPLKVYFKDHNSESGCVTFPLMNDPTELQPLLDVCSPALCGLGRQTLQDDRVHKALQLPSDRLGLGLVNSGTLISKALLYNIRDLMLPDAEGPIHAEPYALNVYSPDGFFKAHRDTPASTDMFGSLVICLPTEFTGGQLIIRSPDLSTCVTHDWGSTSSDRLGATAASSSSSSSSSHYQLAWAAMYSDCEHEKKPVTTGHRATLTYNLYKAANSGHSNSQGSGHSAAAAAAASAAQESAFGTQLSSALSDATWYPEGATLGLVLEHTYEIFEPPTVDRERYYGYGYESSDDSSSSSEDGEDASRQPYSIEPGSLKGSDLQLYRAARAYGLEVKILPVTTLEEFEVQLEELQGAVASGPLSVDQLAVEASFKDPTKCRYWYRPREGCSYGEPWAAFLQSCIARSWREAGGPSPDGDLVWVKPPGKQHLKYRSTEEHDDGDCAYIYSAAAALLVEVPSVGTGLRQG